MSKVILDIREGDGTTAFLSLSWLVEQIEMAGGRIDRLLCTARQEQELRQLLTPDRWELLVSISGTHQFVVETTYAGGVA